MKKEKLHAFREDIYCDDVYTTINEMWTEDRIDEELKKLHEMADINQINIATHERYHVEIYL